MRSLVFVVVATVLTPSSAQVHAQAHAVFGFDGAPCAIAGAGGEEKTFDAFLTVAASSAGAMEGAQGWSMSLTADGGEIEAIRLDGISAPTNAGGFDLADADFHRAELAVHRSDPERRGAVAIVVFSFMDHIILAPDFEAPVARLTVRAKIQLGGGSSAVTLRYEDGFRGGGQPVTNVVTVWGDTFTPDFSAHTVSLGSTLPAAGCDPEPLRAGVPSAIAVTRSQPCRSLSIDTAGREGQALLATLSDPDPSHRNALYVQWDGPAGPDSFVRAADSDQPSQRLVVPIDRSGDLFIGACAALEDDFHLITVLVEFAEVAIESVTPGSAAPGAQGVLNASVAGAGFGPDLTLCLVPAGGGGQIASRDFVFVSPQRVEAAFDLSGTPQGRFDLKAARGGAVAELAGAFTLLEPASGPLLELELHGETFYRCNRTARLTLRLRNGGDAPLSAPLLKVRAPAGTALRLDRDEAFSAGEILVLGANLGGYAAEIPPGAVLEYPLFVRNTACLEDAALEAVDVVVERFIPTSADFVGWDQLDPPGGLTLDEWDVLWPSLSVKMGATWREFEDSLARLAVPAAHRGIYPASAAGVFLLAARCALDRGAAAAVGTLRDAESGDPFAGAVVVALLGGAPASAALTDAAGCFALTCLEGGEAYDLAVVDHEVLAGDSLSLPEDGDLLGVEVLARSEANALGAEAPPCSTAGLPLAPLFPPAALFAPAASFRLRIVRSFDPNEKEGSPEDGDLDAGLIRSGDRVDYTVYFENVPAATAAVQTLVVTDTLDADLDWTTLELHNVQLGGDSDAKVIAIDNQGSDLATGYTAGSIAGGVSTRSGFSGTAEDLPVATMQPDGSMTTEPVDVAIDVALVELAGGARQIRWQFTSESDNPLGGFLPPNDDTHRGEGSVTFSVETQSDLAEGTEVTNDAEIAFDELNPLRTNTVRLTATSGQSPGEPEMPVPPSPPERPVDTDVVLAWEAEGASSFDVMVFEGSVPAVGIAPGAPEGDGQGAGQPVRSFTGLTARSVNVEGLLRGTRYFWHVVAVNLNGRTTGPFWEFVTVAPSGALPDVPSGPAPEDAAVDVSRLPVLAWALTPGAESFNVFVWPAAQPRPLEPNARGFVNRRFPVTEELAPLAPYRWQVIAVNANGVTSGPEWLFTTGTVSSIPFNRGDPSSDGGVDISDAVFVLGFLFLGRQGPTCLKAADTNDDGRVDLSDPVSLLNHLFLGGARPPFPFRECGIDPTADRISCLSYPPCM